MNKVERGLSQLRSGAIADERELRFRSYETADNIDDDDGIRFDPVQLFWFAVHYRWVIATCVACCLAAAVLYTWMQTPIYRAQTTLEIFAPGARVLEEIDAVAPVSDARALRTARQKIVSHDLARRVVFELDLAGSAKFLDPVPTFSLTNIFRRAFGTTNAPDIASLSPAQRERRASGLVRSGLDASLIRGTSILAVTYEHPDRNIAASVVNQVAQSFINQSVDQRAETSTLARDFIEEQVLEVQGRLEASERALVDYAEAEGITLNADVSSLILANINATNARLTDALQNRFELQRYVSQIEAGNADSLPQVFESDAIQAMQSRIIDVRAEYRQKLSTLKPGFPEMQTLQAQLNELNSELNRQITAIADSVLLRYEQSNAAVDALQAELAALGERQSEFQRKNIRYTILQREVDSNRVQYQSLIGKLNNLAVGADLQTTNASLVDEAVPPGSPFTPRTDRNLAFSLLFAALLSAAIIYVLELLKNTFSVPDQIETDLKLPVLGIIPSGGKDFDDKLSDDNSSVSEAYRTLRTSLQFTSAYEETKTLFVTSAESAEGKTVTAFKLAQCFAALGRKVLVIDADMRRPRMHRMFKSDNTIGLSNMLTNVVRSNVETPIFRKSSIENVHFVTAGTLPPNPADLLASYRMGLVLNLCHTRYDLVIIDGPPVMGLADAPVLARLADATLLVVSAKQVKRRSAQNAVKRLTAISGHVVGAVMTKFEVDRYDYYYAYRYMNKDYYSYSTEIEDKRREPAGVYAFIENHPVGRLLRSLRRRFG